MFNTHVIFLLFILWEPRGRDAVVCWRFEAWTGDWMRKASGARAAAQLWVPLKSHWINQSYSWAHIGSYLGSHIGSHIGSYIGSYWPIFLVEFRSHKVDRADGCKAKWCLHVVCPVFFCLRLEELNTKASSWGALRLVHSFTLYAASLDSMVGESGAMLVRCWCDVKRVKRVKRGEWEALDCF